MKPRTFLKLLIIIILTATIASSNADVRYVAVIAISTILFWSLLAYFIAASLENRWDIWKKSETEENE